MRPPQWSPPNLPFPRQVRERGPEALIALVCVIIAGLLTPLGDSLASDEAVHVRIGEPVTISSARQSLQVDAVEVGPRVSRGSGTPLESAGVFVVVRLQLRTPDDALVDSMRCTLHHKGRDSRATVGSTQLIVPVTGTYRVQDLAFERAVEATAGAKLVCRTSEAIMAYNPLYTFDLGLTDEKAAQARGRADAIIMQTDSKSGVIQ